MDFSLRWSNGRFSILKLASRKRLIINLWHGIPLKRLLYAANENTCRHTDRMKYRTEERRGYAGLVASSDIDSYAMSAMFYPLNYRQIWTTGLPRNDFLTMPEDRLPSYVRTSLERIRNIKKERKFILYAPTYRQTSVSKTAHYYQFSKEEIEKLKSLLRENNAVLGYRPHYFKNSNQYFNLDQYIDNELIFDVSQGVVPEYSTLARELDLLVTDYSSVYIEALYLNKPLICFGYDIESYKQNEDGLLYDMRLAFPGPVVEDYDTLLLMLKSRLNMNAVEIKMEQKTARGIFFKYEDGDNSARIVKKIQSMQNKDQLSQS